MKQSKKAGKLTSISSKGQNNKLSEDMENQIKDAFNFYDKQKTNRIKRNDLRSVLGTKAYKMNGKQIQSEIKKLYLNQDTFTLQQTMSMITKKWFQGGGREAEAQEMFMLFDKKQKGLVGLNQIKHVFGQFLDIVVSDADIQQFIDQADLDRDGYLSREEFYAKLGYK